MNTMQNPFIWHDLMTPDAPSAKKFYAAVVGWTFTPQMPTYTVVNAGGLGVGGIMDTPPEMQGMPPVWTGYVFTPDVDAACKQVLALGGKIYREAWDVPGIARMAVVGDPTGAALMIMEPKSTEQRTLPQGSAPGTVGWNELYTSDMDTAWAFYSSLFGWTKGHAHDMGAMGIYQLFQIDGKDIGGMMKKMDSMPMSMWGYYFNVSGIDAAVKRLTIAGGKVLNGPMEVPGGQWTVSAQDPQGAYFNLVSVTK